MLETGIHKAIPMSDYLADSGVSSSSLITIKTHSPMEYQAQLALPNKETAALALGTALHSALMEPESFDDIYVYGENFGPQTSKKNKEVKAAFLEKHKGKIVIPFKDIPLIESCKKALDENQTIKKLIDESEVEVTAIADFMPHVVKGGLRLKTREDLIDKNGWIWDLKTTSDGLSEHQMLRTIYKYNYHFKAAHHMEVMRRAGREINGFGWIFLSTALNKPQFVARKCSDLLMMKAQDDWCIALAQLAMCRKNDYYPGYSEEIKTIGD
jgi:hypothetical protein